MPFYFADFNFNIAADHFSYLRDSAYSESAASCQAFFREVVDVANLQCAMRADETVKHCLQQPRVLFNDPSGDPRLEKRSILMVSSHLQEDHPLRIQPRNNDHVPKYIPGNERFSIQSILGLEQSTSQNALVANPPLDSEQLHRDTSPAGNELDDKATASDSDESLTSTDHCESKELQAARKAYAKSERIKAYQRAYQKAYRQSEKGKARRRAWAQSEKGKACARSWKRRAYQRAYRQSSKGMAGQKAHAQSGKRKVYIKAYQQTEKWKAYVKAYEQTEKRKAYRKAYSQCERVKAYQKVYQKYYRESPQGRACLKAYRKAYHEVLGVTGDIEQARAAGRQATALIREANKANNNEPLREQTGS